MLSRINVICSMNTGVAGSIQLKNNRIVHRPPIPRVFAAPMLFHKALIVRIKQVKSLPNYNYEDYSSGIHVRD